jgi:hypothetical protein
MENYYLEIYNEYMVLSMENQLKKFAIVSQPKDNSLEAHKAWSMKLPGHALRKT